MPATTDPLVSTEWLAAHLNDPNVKVIDASFKMPGVLPLPKDDYLASHIPGAVFFDVDAVSDHSNPLPHMFPSAEQFGRDVGGLGIGNDDTVVLYDSGGWVAAPRVWWMFLSFGKDVRILNGGLKKWVAEGRKVEKGEVTPKPATFKATFDARRTRSMQQLVTNLASRAEQVIDARANERYQGKVAEPRAGPSLRAYPGQSQPALQQPVRCRDRHDEIAGRIAGGVLRRRREARCADRDELRLRRQRRRADACALSPRRREPGAV